LKAVEEEVVWSRWPQGF